MDNFHEMPSLLSPMSKFIQRYLQIVERVNDQISDSILINILSLKDILLTRIENELNGQSWPNDTLSTQVKRRWEGSKTQQGWYQLWWNASNIKGYTDGAKLDSEILKYLGIKGWQHPEEILYDTKEEFPPQKFVLYQDPRTCEYSRFYGSGKAQTRDQFIEELNQTYQGYDDFILKWVSDVQTSPAVITVTYRGNTVIISQEV